MKHRVSRRPIGSRKVNPRGYVTIKTGPGRVRMEHVVVAEAALGHPLPSGAVVHHVDDNRQRNVGENLVILQDNGEHRRLHARRRVLEAGGNPFLDAWCSGCQAPRSIAAFSTGRRRPRDCRDCANTRRRLAA